jgi:DNA repair exonuclease SbcCD ATPase subunit
MERYITETRVCQHCCTEFTPNSGKQVYCGNSCRVSAHKAKSKQHTEELLNLVNDQAERLEVLASEPKTRKEVTQEVNPDWHQIKQKVDAQQKIYSTTSNQLASLNEEIAELIEPRIAKIIGIGLGIAISAIFIAVGYDNRTRRPLSLTFYVLSITGLLFLVIIGYYSGKVLGKQFALDDIQLKDELSDKQKQYNSMKNRLLDDETVLASLEKALSESPQFIKETVLYVDEMVMRPI